MNGKRVIYVWWDMMWILPSPQHWLWSHSKMTIDVQRLEGTLWVCLWWHFQRELTKEEDVPWVWMAPSQGLGSWTEQKGEMKKACQVFPPHQFLVSYEGYRLLWYRTWIHGCSGQIHGSKWLQIDFSKTWVKVNSSSLTHFCQVMVTVTRRWQSTAPPRAFHFQSRIPLTGCQGTHFHTSHKWYMRFQNSQKRKNETVPLARVPSILRISPTCHCCGLPSVRIPFLF